MSTPVSVGFRRSGGFAGVTIGVDTDTRALSPAHGDLIRGLLAGPGGPQGSAPGVPDSFTYELRIDDGQRRRVFRWQEAAVPAAVRPLIADLSARAHPIP